MRNVSVRARETGLDKGFEGVILFDHELVTTQPE